MKRRLILSLLVCLAAFIASSHIAFGHFGVIMVSRPVVDDSSQSQLEISLQFMHPFDFEFMDLERPERFGVVIGGKKVDLTATLRPAIVKSHKTWRANYKVVSPGDHIFFMEPKAYWEPAEGSYIIHYTKVIVGAFGLEDGWDKPIGLKTEIVPLTRPYGIWKGNLFCGKVLLDGKLAPSVPVEVEYYNDKQDLKIPSPAFSTQTLRTDSDGTFCYSIPKAGWWGFSALNTLSKAMKHQGKPVDLELGAVIWVNAHDIR